LKKKILFITHDAYLTGAPKLLLHLISIVKESEQFEIKIVVKNGFGELISDFKSLAQVEIFNIYTGYSLFLKMLKKASRFFNISARNHRVIQKWVDESDIIFSNTITNGDIFSQFDFSKPRLIVSYIHELPVATKVFTTPANLQKVLELSHHYFVPSQSVANHLNQNLKVDSSKISNLNYYIPLQFKQVIANQHKSSNLIIGLMGTLDWRKGADLISLVLFKLRKLYPNSKFGFVWQGVHKNSTEYIKIQHELKQIACEDMIEFIESKKDTHTFFSQIDVFLLLSKEDPYPLVVLEAASYKKPTVCFNESGGAQEFVSNGCGIGVPYLDIDSLCFELNNLYLNHTQIEDMGSRAYDKYLSLHLDKKLILQQFINVVS
jgi:glycosyltransferase involved in cell wall biosynthesis